MSDIPEFTKRGIAFGRLYFAAAGVIFVGIGIAMLIAWESPEKWLGIVAIASGLAGLLYSISKPGKNVAHSAQTLTEDFLDD